ncbi:MAG: hypothetical protein GQ540_03700 [Lutibacter sp.]|uniref:hypothetical protein n=1 Tax=Lutibacter sp. TaxID=1925666 RepID=UPI0019FAD46B|nr:hypothetical protein [Lutibacter sp.]NOR27617.1 hypothetical protein [Lutibacter sp.]
MPTEGELIKTFANASKDVKEVFKNLEAWASETQSQITFTFSDGTSASVSSVGSLKYETKRLSLIYG